MTEVPVTRRQLNKIKKLSGAELADYIYKNITRLQGEINFVAEPIKPKVKYKRTIEDKMFSNAISKDTKDIMGCDVECILEELGDIE